MHPLFYGEIFKRRIDVFSIEKQSIISYNYMRYNCFKEILII